MESTIIRNRLLQYIKEGDDKLLKLMYAIAREYNEETAEDAKSEFAEEDLQRYESRRIKRLSGESKTYSWPEAKQIIKGKNK